MSDLRFCLIKLLVDKYSLVRSDRSVLCDTRDVLTNTSNSKTHEAGSSVAVNVTRQRDASH